MSSRRTNDIEALSEQLRSLQIMEEASSNYEQMNTEMSVALAPALAAISENVQAGIYYGMLWILIIFLFFYLISLILY